MVFWKRLEEMEKFLLKRNVFSSSSTSVGNVPAPPNVAKVDSSPKIETVSSTYSREMTEKKEKNYNEYSMLFLISSCAD